MATSNNKNAPGGGKREGDLNSFRDEDTMGRIAEDLCYTDWRERAGGRKNYNGGISPPIRWWRASLKEGESRLTRPYFGKTPANRGEKNANPRAGTGGNGQPQKKTGDHNQGKRGG